ncbi:unnamed protein product [Prorocentrum cordatum]|uniref:Uncharacterized protein n=1 Tax=Prorocentrum cordatum TaxID=2364126 RepID=A0ABN9UTM5_9DINO|nr:unnamed protein product [Polarella glacialis]
MLASISRCGQPAAAARAPCPSILGIDAAEVLRQVQAEAPPPDQAEAESPGSDSAPSEDNMSHAELVRVGAMLRHKRRHRRRNARSRAGARQSADGGGRGDAGRQRARPRDSRAAARCRRRGNPDRATPSPTTAESPSSPSRRAELLKMVAFGQTTYVRRGGTAAPARPPSGLRLGAAVRDAGGRATFHDAPPSAGGWSSVPQHGVNGSAAAAAAFVVLGPQKDRFSCAQGAPAVAAGAPKEDGNRRRPPSSGPRGGEDA